MELRHLRAFLTVAQEQSFTKAADKLFTAQPSLSRQIKDLEQEVGVMLFDRSSRHSTVTDGEQAFLSHARQAVERGSLAVAPARQGAHQKNNQTRMGCLSGAEPKVMPNSLAKLKQNIADLKI